MQRSILTRHETTHDHPAPAHLMERCLRWNRRRHSHRPAGEPLQPQRYAVESIGEAEAKQFVQREHYSRTYPAARFRVGLLEKRPFEAARLVGVAVFSVPMTQAVITKHLDLPANRGVELGRLVLLEHVPGNGESWFLARAFKLLRASLDVDGVVSFCDPIARTDLQGREVKRSHTGVIYRAHNARYGGRTMPRSVLLMPNGLCASERSLSKIRNEEVGIQYAMQQLLGAGAPARFLGESPSAWLRRLRNEGFLRSVRHPGNHVFTWRWAPAGGSCQ